MQVERGHFVGTGEASGTHESITKGCFKGFDVGLAVLRFGGEHVVGRHAVVVLVGVLVLVALVVALVVVVVVVVREALGLAFGELGMRK